MSKTGGGRGTNQHGIKGASAAGGGSAPKHQRTSAAAPPQLAETVPDWESLLKEYPTFPSAVQAVPEPAWSDLSERVSDLQPKGVDRAVARYLARESKSLHADARLEGFAYTEPEIRTLLTGGHVAGHTAGEEAQVAGMKQASDLMLRFVEDGVVEPSQRVSDDIHLKVAMPLGLKSMAFRGNQREQYEGPQVQLDRGERYRALDARLTPYALAAGLQRIAEIDHPVLRGTTWAAFATYHQFYLDGNKRTGRYVMNAVLMSHGYDSIMIPDRLKAEYEDALVSSYRSGDLTDHIAFLLDQYDDES
ncbi:Fic family protein [Leucobacter sp. cx-169]|uniref:Fic family protein n=1 Tax=Leucobacter sp. cx-169 TaxID=2770549 RepID=UPI00165E8F6D|nr:hypothetical protein [Leucobacter sp. cx-169]MBC9927380.1 hypothetical protein [Leucobacter sp. cx-169]